ncbi:MAG: HU family DNA-binding protein [Actinobacteria bacterium]|nr:HU family DNA-binding protein [Actinomycetota bacterium]
MNKTELIDTTADNVGLTKTDVHKTLEAMLDTITREVRRGEKVALTGFGTFELRKRAARTGRNPQTGERMRVPASKAPAFKPGKAFKDAVS